MEGTVSSGPERQRIKWEGGKLTFKHDRPSSSDEASETRRPRKGSRSQLRPRVEPVTPEPREMRPKNKSGSVAYQGAEIANPTLGDVMGTHVASETRKTKPKPKKKAQSRANLRAEPTTPVPEGTETVHEHTIAKSPSGDILGLRDQIISHAIHVFPSIVRPNIQGAAYLPTRKLKPAELFNVVVRRWEPEGEDDPTEEDPQTETHFRAFLTQIDPGATSPLASSPTKRSMEAALYDLWETLDDMISDHPRLLGSTYYFKNVGHQTRSGGVVHETVFLKGIEMLDYHGQTGKWPEEVKQGPFDGS